MNTSTFTSLVQVLVRIIRKHGIQEGKAGMMKALTGHTKEAEQHQYALQVLERILDDFQDILNKIEEK